MDNTLTDKGLGGMLKDSFVADLAQFHLNRIDKIIPERRSSKFQDASFRFNQLIARLYKGDAQTQEFAREIEDIKDTLVFAAIEVGYNAGYQDGMKTIIATLMR